MASITWSTTTPGTDSTASAVDDQIRADVSALSTGLQQFLYWTNGSAASDGEFLAGTLRLTNVASAKNPRLASNEEGWLALHRPGYVSDGVHASSGYQYGGLYHIGADHPALLGHAAMVERYPMPTTTTSRWVTATGSQSVSATSSALMSSVITYGVEYSHGSDVRVFLSIQPSPECGVNSADLFTYGVDNVSATTCGSFVSWSAHTTPNFIDSGSPTLTLHWMSEGTVNY